MNYEKITNESDLFSFFENKSNILMMVSASWCGPCKSIKPTFEDASKIYKNISFAYVDVNQYDEGTRQFIDNNVSALPTFLFLKNKNIVGKIEGGNPEKLKKFIDTYNAPINNKSNNISMNNKNNNNNELDSYWKMSNNIIN